MLCAKIFCLTVIKIILDHQNTKVINDIISKVKTNHSKLLSPDHCCGPFPIACQPQFNRGSTTQGPAAQFNLASIKSSGRHPRHWIPGILALRVQIPSDPDSQRPGHITYNEIYYSMFVKTPHHLIQRLTSVVDPPE